MSIETKAKELVKLQKKKERLQKQLETITNQIDSQKEVLSEIFKGIGLDSSFSR